MDITPDEEMLNEGVLRDIINRIQRLRKELKIVPTDDITIYFQTSSPESKLDTLLKKSIDFVESNIKKPFRPFDKSLTLTAKSKSFDVSYITYFFSVFLLYLTKILKN